MQDAAKADEFAAELVRELDALNNGTDKVKDVSLKNNKSAKSKGKKK